MIFATSIMTPISGYEYDYEVSLSTHSQEHIDEAINHFLLEGLFYFSDKLETVVQRIEYISSEIKFTF